MSVKRLLHLGNSSSSFPQIVHLTHPLGPFNKIRVSQIIFDNSDVATDNNYYVTLDSFDDHHDQSNNIFYFQWFYAFANNVVNYAPADDRDGWVYSPRDGLTTIRIGLMQDGTYSSSLSQKFIVELEFGE